MDSKIMIFLEDLPNNGTISLTAAEKLTYKVSFLIDSVTLSLSGS